MFTFSVPNPQTSVSKQKTNPATLPTAPLERLLHLLFSFSLQGPGWPGWLQKEMGQSSLHGIFNARSQDILTASAIQAPSATNSSFLGSQPSFLVFGQRLGAMPRNWLPQKTTVKTFSPRREEAEPPHRAGSGLFTGQSCPGLVTAAGGHICQATSLLITELSW